ncbi:MAG: type II toxin-antitoxin system HicA family toxin [Methylovulum sp.]|nr:type II toxin-antitoxin system HicA family toxin [Methylovulum sp.]
MVSTRYPQWVELLRSSGCVFVRQGKGGHEIWRSPINGKIFCVPFTIKSKPTANAILKQAGLTSKI